MNLFLLFVCAVLYGYIEQLVYRNGFMPPEHTLFGKFSLKYHVPMVVFWFAICYGLGYWWAIGLFAMLEDFSYFFFHPGDTLDREDWVSMGWGGFHIGDQFIPYTYLVLIGLSAILVLFDVFVLNLTISF